MTALEKLREDLAKVADKEPNKYAAANAIRAHDPAPYESASGCEIVDQLRAIESATPQTVPSGIASSRRAVDAIDHLRKSDGAADPDVPGLIEKLRSVSYDLTLHDRLEAAAALQRQAEELAAANAKLEAAERRVMHLEDVLINLRKMCDPNMSHQENLMSRKIDAVLSKGKP